MVKGLDGLRAVAFLLVFLFHCKYLAGGWVGMQLFFVLSGFLITGILVRQRESEGSARGFFFNFYGRRVLRIFPVYHAYLLLAGLVIGVLGDFLQLRPDRFVDYGEQLPYALTYVYDFYHASSAYEHSHLLTPFWSLSVEEQFYLLWPLLIHLTPPKRVKTMLWATSWG